MKYQNCAAVAQAPDEPFDLDVGLRLSDANINPSTGLATDYLNRFNEAVMLLDMLATCPEFRDDFLSWEPMSSDLKPETITALAGNAVGWLKPMIARAGGIINGDEEVTDAASPQAVVDQLMKR